MDSTQSTHYCYVIYNDQGLTYNGYTVDPARRLRQHNKEIKGGAKYTSRHSGWKYLYIVTSPQFTKNTALSFEWSVKYPNNKRPRPKQYSSVHGRLESLQLVLRNPKFAGLDIDLVYIADIEYLALVPITLQAKIY